MADNVVLVAFSELKDGTHLAASFSNPLFCVSGETEDEAKAKAQGAIDFWYANRHAKIEDTPERTVTQFTPQRVEALCAPAEACA